LKLGPEDIQSMIFYDWVVFNKLDAFIFHIGNERACSPQAGSILKRKGIKAGVCDYLVLKPNSLYHGLGIELKAGKGKTSPAQLEFLQTMRDNGYDGAVCVGADRAIEHLKSYLQLA